MRLHGAQGKISRGWLRMDAGEAFAEAACFAKVAKIFDEMEAHAGADKEQAPAPAFAQIRGKAFTGLCCRDPALQDAGEEHEAERARCREQRVAGRARSRDTGGGEGILQKKVELGAGWVD